MNREKLDELLIMECMNNMNHDEVGKILHDSGTSVDDYNKYILERFNYKDGEGKSLKTNSFGTLEPFNTYEKNETLGDDSILLKTRNNLEKFFSIDMCPSFIMHDSLLCKDDYMVLLEIYSNFYNLEHRNDDEIATYLNKRMNMYFKLILDQCDGEVTVEKLKKNIKHL